MKKIIILSLAILMMSLNLVSMNSVQASTPVSIQPMFSNIAVFSNSYTLSTSGVVSVASYITASNVDSCRVDVSLQQLKNGVWTTIKTWTNTSIGTSVGLSGTYPVQGYYYYRIVSTGAVYKKGALIEKTTYISTSKYY